MNLIFSIILHHHLFWHIAVGAFIGFLSIPIAFALLDFIDRGRMLFRKHAVQSYAPYNNFVILVPIFNDIRYFRNAHYLKQYRSKVIVCTTEHESEQFYADLDNLCNEYGFRQHRSDLAFHQSGGLRSRNPWKIFTHVLDYIAERDVMSEEAREAMLIESSLKLRYKYCMFLDGDTVCGKDLRLVMGEFVARDLDLASVRVVPSRALNLIQHMQRIEYQIAMDARKQYPWLTSGACMIAKTKTLQHALGNHSHFFQGGDIEIGKLSRLLGYKVGHIEVHFLTDVPDTFQKWFRQRVAWSSGDFRHAIVNINTYSWRHPFYFLYFTLVVYLMLPLRLWFAVTEPLILPVVIVIYWALLFIFMWRYRSRYMLAFPFYAMIQTLIVVPLGIFFYFYSAYRHRNVGLIRLRSERRKRLFRFAGAAEAEAD
jgi:cellulose synthase/poly-beta-1,6-N-acetylglucosamine synthase-like glycosyltransferase